MYYPDMTGTIFYLYSTYSKRHIYMIGGLNRSSAIPLNNLCSLLWQMKSLLLLVLASSKFKSLLVAFTDIFDSKGGSVYTRIANLYTHIVRLYNIESQASRHLF